MTIVALPQYVPQTGYLPVPDGIIPSLTMPHRPPEGLPRQTDFRQQAKILEVIDQAVMITEPDLDWPQSRITYVNRAFTTLLGYVASEVIGQTPRILQCCQTDWAVLERLRQELAVYHTFQGMLVYEHTNGSCMTLELTIRPLYELDGTITHWVATLRDLTAYKQLEAELLQAQKIASIGRLTGGLAHDFNNLLTVILGDADLALTDLTRDQAIYHTIEDIQQAARRAAGLVRQLLGFARRQPIDARALDINDLLQNLAILLQRFIDPTIELVMNPAPDLRLTWADRGQIEQVLVNLVINARDAMPSGGRLTITTRHVVVEDAQNDQGAKRGVYTYLEVTDTGIGMDEATKAHLFEPFFTTKGPDRGTGLGLVMCARIISHHGGHIFITSARSQGTTVHLYLPVAMGLEPHGRSPSY